MDILIVDSSKVFHQMASQLFADTEMTPTLVGSGREALAQLEKGNIHFVCGAFHLPDMTGVELCQRVRELPEGRYLPFVLLTSEGGEGLARSAMAAGVTEVFFREEADALVNFIRHLLFFRERIEARVLLVDDVKTQRLFYKETLVRLGARVDDFVDAQQALAALEENDYDVIVTDVVLGGTISGVGFVNRIRRMPGARGGTPILAMTAFDDLTRRIELFHLGVNDYVLKPVEPVEFTVRIRNLVSMRSRVGAR